MVSEWVWLVSGCGILTLRTSTCTHIMCSCCCSDVIIMSLQIVGGMTWCLQASNFDVDVDLLFQENSTIGQKM